MALVDAVCGRARTPAPDAEDSAEPSREGQLSPYAHISALMDISVSPDGSDLTIERMRFPAYIAAALQFKRSMVLTELSLEALLRLVAGMQDMLLNANAALAADKNKLAETNTVLGETQVALAKAMALNKEFEGERPNSWPLFELAAKPSKSGGDAKGAGAVHDFLHAMLTYLGLAQVDPMQYIHICVCGFYLLRRSSPHML